MGKSYWRGIHKVDSKSGKSWLLGSDKGSAGHVRLFGSETNAEKIAAAVTGGILSSPVSKMEIPS
jgi:hypothetical protein